MKNQRKFLDRTGKDGYNHYGVQKYTIIFVSKSQSRQPTVNITGGERNANI